MDNMKAVSLAVFAASFVVTVALYRVINSDMAHEQAASGQQMTMFINSLDMQPLFSQRANEISQD